MFVGDLPDGAVTAHARHPGDVLRVLVGTIALVASGFAAGTGVPGRFQRTLVRLISDLPSMLAVPLRVMAELGSLAVVPIASGVAFAFGRVRMALGIALSGTLSWVLAGLLREAIEPGGVSVLHEALIGSNAADGFPSHHAAVAAAIVASAAPYLSRPARRAAWAAIGLMAIALVYAAADLPIDVVGGAALGWTVGAALHLLFGAPGPGASAALVRRALEAGGIVVRDLDVASVDGRGSTAFVARTDDGRRLLVKVVSREQRNADWLFKAWRFLAFKLLEDEAPFATPKQQVEHEAYLALLAKRAGVRVPHIVSTGVVEGGAAYLAEELIDGRTLENVVSGDVGDDVLRKIWQQVRLLHQARIAHRDLRRANVLVDRSGNAWILDFGFAEAAATNRRLAQDVAEMLTSLALIVGAKRAVRAANEALGRDSLVQAVPFLQPLALSAATRHELKARQGLLAELRGGIGSTVTAELPPVEPLTRIKARTLLLLLATAVAIHLLLPQVGELRQTFHALTSAQPLWLLAGLLASALSYVMAAIALVGATARPLPLSRTIAVQVATSFVNRLVPGGFGGLGTNARYLERCGVIRTDALAAVALNAAAGVAVHVVGLVVSAALLGGHEIGASQLPSGWVVLVAVVGVLTLAGVVWWSPRVRERVVGPGRQAARALVHAARQPRQAMRLFGGSIGVTASYAVALIASLHAFGAEAPAVGVVAVYLGASAVGSVSPTPGGLGAVEAALVAGLTGVGVAAGPSIAGVLAFRLLTFWLPIVPGVLVFRRLTRSHVI